MENDRKTEQCMVCGSRLVSLKTAEELTCTYCSAMVRGHVKCPEGHFACEACHKKEALPVIEETVLSSREKDPVVIAELLMSHPALPMQGCEHAYIAAGAFLAALRNSRYAKITDQEIREVFTRTAKQAVSGHCGLTGVCGIVPALGACFSVFLGARCGSDNEQKITMEAVIRISEALAELTGPSCCKAYVRAALSTAVDLFAERFGIVLPIGNKAVICRHSGKHPHGCREEKCPYYLKQSKDIFADSIHLPVTVCHS